MMIVLRIRTDGAVWDAVSGEELARVLRSLAQQAEAHDMRVINHVSWYGEIVDADGNRCGTLRVED